MLLEGDVQLKILLICRGFAPDNVIGAIRITKLARYFSDAGHDVTVIRSGLIKGKPSLKNMEGLEKVRIYSYEGDEAPAENFERGIEDFYIKSNSEIQKKRTNGFLKKTLHLFYDLFVFYYKDTKRVNNKIMDLYIKKVEIRGFDVVFSTFSPFGCILAGKQISRRENSKLIIDFRDLMTNTIFTPILRFVNNFTQRHFVNQADAVFCVSLGNTKVLKKKCRNSQDKIHTVFNGYDKSDIFDLGNKKTKTNELTICYTGTLYGGLRDITPLFQAIANINTKIGTKIKFLYAGADGLAAKKQAKKCGVEHIITDMGMLTREDAAKVQAFSDIFLVVTWNTKVENGILTGKFYESLARKKPVIGIVAGDEANSELKQLIDQYKLGFCYEETCRDSGLKGLENYLIKQCEYKKVNKIIFYNPDESVFDEFAYDGIAKKALKIIEDLVRSENKMEE